MRILWLCNICPPAVAAALGQSYSVREGWLTGALNRFWQKTGRLCSLPSVFRRRESLPGCRRKYR